MPLNVQDALVSITGALPAGATTTKTAALDLGVNAGTYVTGQHSDFVALVEFELDVPALAVGALPNSDSITYALVGSNTDSTLASPTTLIPELAIQTGAGGVGAAALAQRFRLPSGVTRYIGVTATGSASGVAASGSNMTVNPFF